MRLLGLPIAFPDAVAARAVSDLAALARAARGAPDQIERMLTLAEELVAIGGRVLELGERIDARAEAILALGERMDARAGAIIALGGQIDARGAEIVDGATRVTQSAGDLIGVIPTLERAIEMTTPLEGAIDRFGRLVDRLPGGNVRRRSAEVPTTTAPGPSTDRPAPADDPAPGRS